MAVAAAASGWVIMTLMFWVAPPGETSTWSER